MDSLPAGRWMAAGAEVPCGVPGGGGASALRWMRVGGIGVVVEVLLRGCVRFKFIFGGFWIIIVVKVCWFGFEGGLWGLPGFWREWVVCVIIWFCRF